MSIIILIIKTGITFIFTLNSSAFNQYAPFWTITHFTSLKVSNSNKRTLFSNILAKMF